MTRLELLAIKHPHGTRVRYMTGCKCVPCRAANSRYETDRAAARKNGDWNGLVPTDLARNHLFALSHKGIGRRTVAEASGVSVTVISAIKSGKKKNVRTRTHKAIMAVDASARAANTLVKARPVWAQINRLLREGFTQTELARRLGSRAKIPALQLNGRVVTARNAMRVERLHAVIMAGAGIRLRWPLNAVAQRQKSGA
jgi:transcriptional regulator with XRE-family HTH domain